MKKIGEVFYHQDLEDGWYALYVDGKKFGEYHHFFQISEIAKENSLDLKWGENQKAAANYYHPKALKG